MSRRDTERSTPKKATPLQSALLAGASCYVEDSAPGALILDFNPLRNETKIDSKKFARKHYTAVAEDLKNTYPLTVNALAPEQLRIRIEGEPGKALLAWLEENKLLKAEPNLSYTEPEDLQPLPIQEMQAEAASRPRYRKPVTEKSDTVHKRIAGKQPSGITLADFLTALDREPASLFGRNDSPLTQEDAREQLLTLHTRLMKLAPPHTMPDDAKELFTKTITAAFEKADAEHIPLITRTLAREMLANAQMTGGVEVSKIASNTGFNITLAQGMGESHGEWQKRTEVLAHILASLLQKPDEPKPQLNHQKGRIIAKMDAQSANYEPFAMLASQTQQTGYRL